MLSGSFSKDAILEAAQHSATFPWVFPLLMVGVVITGAYTGRLWWGIFQGADGEATHHAAEHAGHTGGFDLPLLPLAAGAIGLGYLEAGTHGLSTILGAAVKKAPEVHLMPTGLGLGAFALGLVGVGIGVFLARTQQKGLPVPGGELSSSVLGEFRTIPDGLAAVHNGTVGRYLVATVLGTAVVAALAARPVSGPLPTAGRPAAGTTRDDGKEPGGRKAGRDGEKKPLRPSKLPPQLEKAIRDGTLKPVDGGKK
jgi:NADH:ubiquinone oxidoreductase subunit 5 (subunit L)/multisubunit Na+/H+ antiporter MnhA subunit